MSDLFYIDISLGTLGILLVLHFVADFLAQSDRMALNKSHNLGWLVLHVLTYSVFFLPFGLEFVGWTLLAHFITDFLSSRATSRLWAGGHRHWFFVVIGLDQLAHYCALLATWYYTYRV